MTILTTYRALVDVVAGSSGITTCNYALPQNVNDSDLPMAIITVGAGVWNEQAVGLKRRSGEYVIRVYVKPTAEDISPDAGYQAVLPILNALGTTLLDNIDLSDTVDHIGDNLGRFPDGGVEELTFAGVAYYGCTVRLQVTEKTT